MSLKEYKQHEAKKLNGSTNQTLLDKVNTALEAVGKYAGYSVLIDIPRPSRTSNKESIHNPYIVKKGDTLSSITKKITGKSENWNDLYLQNKESIGEAIISDELVVGTKLTLPDSWVNNKSYNIVNG